MNKKIQIEIILQHGMVIPPPPPLVSEGPKPIVVPIIFYICVFVLLSSSSNAAATSFLSFRFLLLSFLTSILLLSSCTPCAQPFSLAAQHAIENVPVISAALSCFHIDLKFTFVLVICDPCVVYYILPHLNMFRQTIKFHMTE